MDLRFTPEEIAFRAEVRTFIQENLPADTRDRMKLGHPPRKEDTVRWQRILNAKGWAGLSWPKEWGGPGWSAIQKMIFLEENLMAPAPELLSFNITMLGPVLIQFGTEAQKKRFLPRAANLDDWWCQGFSEPGAGSDLASLKTAAKLDGDHYVVNGQKIWTSTAHNADWCFLLVRTDPNARKRQEGISFLLVDMKTPGVTVRPIISIDGGHHLNEVFFDDVRVPVDMRIHTENKGWDVAKYLLGNERTGIARLGKSRERVKAAVSMAKDVNFGGEPLIQDPTFRQRVAQLQVDMKALEITQYRVVSAYDKAKGAGKPDPLSSVLKVKGTELLQATSELAVDVAGPMATPMWAQELAEMNEPDELMEAGSAGTGGYLMLRAALDLRRHQRDTEEHPDQSGIGAVMDFEPSDDQRLLVESVSRMLGDTYGFAQRKGYMALPEGYSPAVWSQFAEQGLLGLPFAEDYGGFGGSAQEVMLVMQAFGRVLVLEPYFPTVVLAGTALNVAGTADQKAALLPAIAEGSLKMAFAHGERQARYDLTDVVTTAKRNGGGWVLDGSKTVVSHGEAADKIIVSARTSGDRYDESGITLFVVDAGASGVARRGYRSRDDSRAADISLSNVSDAEVLGEVGGGLAIIQRVVEAGIAATAGETVGAMEAMNEMTLDYSKTRVQFGNPIGSYQVVQHRLADMFMLRSRAAAWRCWPPCRSTIPMRLPGRMISRWRRWGLGRLGDTCRRARCRCMAASA